MADTRLPDVVPTNKESGDIAIGEPVIFKDNIVCITLHFV